MNTRNSCLIIDTTNTNFKNTHLFKELNSHFRMLDYLDNVKEVYLELRKASHNEIIVVVGSDELCCYSSSKQKEIMSIEAYRLRLEQINGIH
ncbi:MULTISPECIES: hypothetical protein [unclassified Fusibacter]|uniref:hypothetical protein n=1 Tax=unclassified Fusibacter TaxID=2624464 RepID=UPI0010102DE3|nr:MULTISPECIES: hypothetical protein [unclassified Fusibacter]MCK8058843.1 hypothetical protein [Fusibacter sp. A2]NPE21917.1 hypothetical protein [Fusibacter sp. A1]RXV61487.1 hypothetical protein DWB64_08735 [Fusibacter sp. A1]